MVNLKTHLRNWKFLAIDFHFFFFCLSIECEQVATQRQFRIVSLFYDFFVLADRNPRSSVFELKKQSGFHSAVEVLKDSRFDPSIFLLFWDFVRYRIRIVLGVLLSDSVSGCKLPIS